MNLKGRISKLEQMQSGQVCVLLMQHGRTAKIPDGAFLDSLVAAMLGEQHPVLATVRTATGEVSGGKIFGLIQAIDNDEHRNFMASVRGGRGACAAQH